MAIRWVHTTSLANIFNKGGWPHGGFIQDTLQFGARMDGHTVGPSQIPCNLWARVGGHTVGTSQIPCKTIHRGGWPYGGHIPDSLQNNLQDWVAIRWAHPNYLVPLKQIIDHTVGRCLRMVSDVISKTITAQDNNACDCKQGWMATRWAHPRMLS